MGWAEGKTRKKGEQNFRAGPHGPEPRPLGTRSRLMKARSAPGRACGRQGSCAPARRAHPRERSRAECAARGEAATPALRAGPARRGALGLRVPSARRSQSVPRPPTEGNKLITIIPAQSIFFLDVNHGGAGITRLKRVQGAGGGVVGVGEKKRGLRRGVGEET